MSTAIIASSGQLGHAFALELAAADRPFTGLTHADLDICDTERIERVLGDIKPRCVINTAAYNQVDAAENDPEGAFSANAFAVRELAKVCAHLDATLVHFSSDFVFDGSGREPYDETAMPSPQSVYAMSKLAGEHFARAYCPKHLVIRTCGLYGHRPSTTQISSFAEKMLQLAAAGRSLKVVNDQVVTPTFVRDLAASVIGLLALQESTPPYEFWGLYHITNAGACSWYEFARALFDEAGLDVDLAPTTAAEYKAPAARPAYSVLAHKRLLALGLPELRPWREALRAFLGERAAR